MRGNERVATVLLEAGADVHAVCNQQRTALHWAAVKNRGTMVRSLLAAGALAAAVCDEGSLAPHEACSHGADCDLQIIKQLVSSTPEMLNKSSKLSNKTSSVTPLLLAIGRGCSTEVALFLITSGADVNAADMVGTPVLMLTSDLAMVQLLLDAGAAVNARDLLGNTVLHTAAHFDRSAGIICCLLKAGGDVTATDTTGSTPAE
eukprot:809-Heterococcus_DN1.PRE.1